MNVERLTKLANHLDTVPEHGFDMRQWGNGTAAELKKAHEDNYECGLAACVGGHAAMLFPNVLEIICANDLVTYPDAQGFRLWGSDAFAKAMDLCKVHATRLTNPQADHQLPKDAAIAIRKLIELDPPCCRS